tara:strand:+ start:770 stop:1393 length:624 start_codon:yes stop_codon:yes gene_type:complete
MIDLINDDCMNVLKKYNNNHFDLAIVDPPYGIGLSFSSTDNKKWNNNVPNMDYFTELKRVSKEQIIWGINYYPKLPYDKGGRIVWYKVPNKTNVMKISDCELALYSKHKRVAFFEYQYYGNVENYSIDWSNSKRIHPTQKPIKLYDWLLQNYAKKNYKILDTHLGSGSIAIACHYFGCDLVGIEIDKEYFDKAKNRFNDLTRQESLF